MIANIADLILAAAWIACLHVCATTTATPPQDVDGLQMVRRDWMMI